MDVQALRRIRPELALLLERYPAVFRTKPELALGMIQQTVERGLSFR